MPTRELTEVGYLDLLPVFLYYPSIYELMKNGGNVELKHQFMVSLDNQHRFLLYSNTEQIYLPPATPDDDLAYHYIQSHIEEGYRSEFLKGASRGHWEDMEYLVNRCPSSIIADFAKLSMWTKLFHKIKLTELNKQIFADGP